MTVIYYTFQHSHWWKRRSRSNKFTSHYSTVLLRHQQSMRTRDGCKVDMDSYVASDGSCFMVTWIHFLEVGLRQNRETHGFHNCCFILFYHVWGLAWIEVHWHSVWLRAWSHMTSHYTWGYVTTLHDFGGVLGRPLDTCFWALIISWSRLLARVRSGPDSLDENLTRATLI
jgi:hypothetical protein